MTKDQWAELVKSALTTIAKENLIRKITIELVKIVGIKFMSSAVTSFFVTPIIGFIAGWIAEKAIDGGEMLTYFAYTDVRVHSQGTNWVSKAKENQDALLSKDKERIQRAKEELMDAHRKFVKFTT